MEPYDIMLSNINSKQYGMDFITQNQFKKDLYRVYDVINNYKRNVCFDMALEYSRGRSYNELLLYWDDFVKLIKE